MSASTAHRARLLRNALLCALGAFALIAAAGAARASAAEPWWSLQVHVAPTKLRPGQEVQMTLQATNIGNANINGASTPEKLSETLPEGIETSKLFLKTCGAGIPLTTPHHESVKLTCSVSGQTISTTYSGSLPPYAAIEMHLKGVVSSAAELEEGGALPTSLPNQAVVEGGGAPRAVTDSRPLAVAQEATKDAIKGFEETKFGVERYELTPEEEGGTVDTQAGAHPFSLTTTFNLNEEFGEYFYQEGHVNVKGAVAPRLPKNLHFSIPPGLIGNAIAVPKCGGVEFATLQAGDSNLCPANTAIGVATVTLIEPHVLSEATLSVPVFNLEPEEGEPARFGFEAEGSPVVLTTAVKSGSDYGVEVTVHEADETVEVLGTQLSLWGNPSDSIHNSVRGWECLYEGAWEETAEHPKPCPAHPEDTKKAFLTMPTVCNAPTSGVSGESWPFRRKNEITEKKEGTLWENASVETIEEAQEGATFRFPTPFTGCQQLHLEPTVSVEPESHAASTPTGLSVKIRIPQESTLSAGGLAEADIRSTTLALPVGMTTNGSSANGLLSCAASQMGFLLTEFGEALSKQTENDHFSPAPASCPDQSKIGTVDIKTPLLEHELTGSVYLARVNTGVDGIPFTTPLGLYLTAEDKHSGVVVKLAGEIQINPSTGQLVSVFRETPPLPFEELAINLFGGSRAAQATPPSQGSYAAVAEFAPSTGGETVTRTSTFQITSGPAPGTQPFEPSFSAGAADGQAGAFSPFQVTIVNPDESQPLKSISVTEPKGAAAILASVTPCPVEQATAPVPSCPASSEIGESVALIGLGNTPVEVKGNVYLTTGYKGAPFGLLSVTNAEKVGPFDLGRIGVMSTITVNETTAQATITSDPLPKFAPLPGQPGTSTGIPSQIKELFVNVNRAGFAFNPTNCAPLETTGTLTGYGPGGADGAVAVSTPFHASNCAALPFKPTIHVAVESNVSRVDGTGMVIKITSGKGQANIGKTRLEFPKVIPSRLPTLHESCLDKVFEENPAKCGERAIIGTAIAHTPVLKSPLVGPVYLVSHGSAAFPDAEILLQGEGIKLLLDGQTEISESGANKGVTISSFESVPDAPVETFEVNLPRKQYSAFSGYGNLCEEKPMMPTKFTGQNGAVMEEKLKIDVTGCSGVLPTHTENELAKLLKVCKKAKSKKARTKCEANAHKRYSAIQSCKKKDKSSKSKRVKCEATARNKYVVKA